MARALINWKWKWNWTHSISRQSKFKKQQHNQNLNYCILNKCMYRIIGSTVYVEYKTTRFCLRCLHGNCQQTGWGDRKIPTDQCFIRNKTTPGN